MKKIWFIVVVVFLCASVIGGYTLLDSIFPKADAISCPPSESISSVSLTQSGNSSVTAEAEDFEELLHNIRSALPTRRMSVNDSPSVKDYYTLSFETSEREYRYFIYKESSQVYIELPYEGIYRSDRQVLDSLTEYFRD